MIGKLINYIKYMFVKFTAYVYIKVDGFIIPLFVENWDLINGLYEPALRRFIEENGDKKKSMVDVGAHMGMVSIWASKYFKKVYSFEPMNKYIGILQHIVEINKIDNVKSFMYGLGKKEESKYMEDVNTLSRVVEGVTENKVRIKKLDSFELDDVGLLKIDVEGMEYDVLLGAEKTIEKCKPIVVFERNGLNEKTYDQISSFLKKYGYKRFDYKLFDEYWAVQK